MELPQAAMLERYQAAMIERGLHHALECWDERTFEKGERGREALQRALERAQVVILILSLAFLASDVLGRGDLPRLLQEAQAAGARVLPILLGLANMQATPFGPFPAFNEVGSLPVAQDDSEPEALWRSLGWVASDETHPTHHPGVPWDQLGQVVVEILRTPYPLETTRLIYSGHIDSVNALCWSPDGRGWLLGGLPW